MQGESKRNEVRQPVNREVAGETKPSARTLISQTIPLTCWSNSLFAYSNYYNFTNQPKVEWYAKQSKERRLILHCVLRPGESMSRTKI